MADTAREAEYFYVEVEDRPGEGARVLSKLREAGINLLAFSGFPTAGGKAQLDFVPEDPAAFQEAVGQMNVSCIGPRHVLLLSGEDRPGVVADVLGKLNGEGISVTSLQAIQAGAGRWGMIVWVDPADHDLAVKAVGA
ncbi:MAG: ACT domain-containing protein [Planctomycetota bacterium]|jgi:hypothetical protein